MNRRQFFRRLGLVGAAPAAAVAAPFIDKPPAELEPFHAGEILTAERLNKQFSMVVNGDVLVRGKIVRGAPVENPDCVASFRAFNNPKIG